MPAKGPLHNYSTPYGDFTLSRYPVRDGDTLLPWCSADSLLLEACHQRAIDTSGVMVLNDEHGALSLSLRPLGLWTDSWLSAQGMRENARLNQQDPTQVTWSTESPGAGARSAVIRVPKQLPYFEHQLASLATLLPVGATVLAAGMDKHLSPNTADIMERYLGPTERHRGRSHARLFSATVDGARPSPASHEASYFCEPLGLELRAAPNVFSRDKLDLGSRFLLQHLGALSPAARVVDLACGNGVLGLAALMSGLTEKLVVCDESAMAIESARNNLQQHSRLAAVQYHHGDGLLDLAVQGDLILCNPPFHQQHTVDEFVGRRLIRQAADYLEPGGRLCLVANRHLGYQSTLRRLFSRVEILAENRKFRIWLAQTG